MQTSRNANRDIASHDLQTGMEELMEIIPACAGVISGLWGVEPPLLKFMLILGGSAPLKLLH